jgi:antitoxin Phd
VTGGAAPGRQDARARAARSADELRAPQGSLLYIHQKVLYDSCMATMNISAARERLPEAVELAHSEAVFLERYGRRAAVLLSPERYDELMEALEEAEDVAAFDAAMAEEGPNIPWDQAKADLGWT